MYSLAVWWIFTSQAYPFLSIVISTELHHQLWAVLVSSWRCFEPCDTVSESRFTEQLQQCLTMWVDCNDECSAGPAA